MISNYIRRFFGLSINGESLANDIIKKYEKDYYGKYPFNISQCIGTYNISIKVFEKSDEYENVAGYYEKSSNTMYVNDMYSNAEEAYNFRFILALLFGYYYVNKFRHTELDTYYVPVYKVNHFRDVERPVLDFATTVLTDGHYGIDIAVAMGYDNDDLLSKLFCVPKAVIKFKRYHKGYRTKKETKKEG